MDHDLDCAQVVFLNEREVSACPLLALSGPQLLPDRSPFGAQKRSKPEGAPPPSGTGAGGSARAAARGKAPNLSAVQQKIPVARFRFRSQNLFPLPRMMERAMSQHRRRPEQSAPLDERLAEEAKRLHEEALRLPPGPAREEALRRARRAETGSHISEWLRSPGLRPPR
jgi:hypothetical protein